MIGSGDDLRRDAEMERSSRSSSSSVSMIGDADAETYDPGWLGVVLRWPLRVVAVVVIMPVQVVWESAKAAGNAVGKGLQRVGRPLRKVLDVCVGRPVRFIGQQVARALRPIGHGLEWVATRLVWQPVKWLGKGIGRGTAAFARGVMRVLRPLGHGAGVALAAIAAGLEWCGHRLSTAALAVGRPFGRGLRWVARGVGHGLTALGHVIAHIGHYLFIPIRLAGRGIWFVAKLLGGWLAGLVHVVGEAFAYAWRVGSKIGQGFVWLWTHTLWGPLSWFGRGLRSAWLSVWQPLKASARRMRIWYRREVTGPVRAALAAARRDVRRAIGRQ